MSKVTEKAFDSVHESTFTINDENHTMEVMNAVIFWTNFRGETNRFGNSARYFNLAINEEVAKTLADRGWRVRDVDVYDDGQKLYFVNIKVNMESNFPPIITLFSEFKGKRSRRSIGLGAINELDSVDIQSADCIINEYSSRAYPGKVTGYLKKLNIIQEPDIEFGGKYDDWMNEEDPDIDVQTPGDAQ